MADNDLSSRLDLALATARAAGEFILTHYRQDQLAVEQKADATPVTIADREAELLMRARISAAFPDDGILGEEHDEVPGSSGYRWILDPIDGTVSFVRGAPLFGTLIGIERGERSVIGVINLPALDESVYGAVGMGAWSCCGAAAPRPARVSNRARLADALVCSTSVTGFERHDRLAIYQQLRTAAALDRGWGDCYGYALVATGRAEVMLDPKMSLWDIAALQPIIEEAGGTLTDWQGRPTIYAGEAIATNGAVLEEVLAITRGG